MVIYMKIAQSPNIGYPLTSSGCKNKQANKVGFPVFQGKDFISNSIKSDINKAILNFHSKNTVPTVDEIKNLVTIGREKVKDAELLKLEYGEKISEKFITAMQAQRKDYFIGKNPNFDETVYNIESYFEQFKIYSDEEKMSLAAQLANLNNGKYLNFWRANPEKLLFFINNTEYLPSQLKNFNTETWDAVISSFIKIFEDGDKTNIINAIIKYARDGFAHKVNFLPQINDLLKSIIIRLETRKITFEEYQKEILKLNSLIKHSKITQDMEQEQEKRILMLTKPLPDNISLSSQLVASNLKKFILEPMNKICSFNEVQELIKDLKRASITSTERDSKIPIWRDDNLSFFDSIDIEGEQISSLMDKAKKDTSSRIKVLKYFNDTQPTIKRNSFLSTAIKPHEFMERPVKWHFSLEKGIKYLYIEPFKCFSSETEAEILIHPCRLKINKAEYNANRWLLDAQILPI